MGTPVTWSTAARVGAHAPARLRESKARHALIGDVCGIGLLLGVELVRDRATKEPAIDEANAVPGARPSFKTTFGNVLTLSPPLTITEAEMDEALAILDEALEDGGDGSVRGSNWATTQAQRRSQPTLAL